MKSQSILNRCSMAFSILDCGKLSITYFIDNVKNTLFWHPPVDSNSDPMVLETRIITVIPKVYKIRVLFTEKLAKT